MAVSQLSGLQDIKDPLLQKCRDYYKISATEYADTILEGQEIIDMYHNRQYTQAQLVRLKELGQPAETFNVIKMFTNIIVGYLETVVTSVSAVPRYPNNSILANIVNDVLQAILDDSDWESVEKFIKIDGILTGLMAAYEDVVDTGVKDEFGRPVYQVKLTHVPSYEIRIDPQSTAEDYSDARFIHHFKWMPKTAIESTFGRAKAKKLQEYYDFLAGLGEARSDWFKQFDSLENGEFKQYDSHLVVKTIVEHKGKIYSVVWSDYVILEKEELTFREVRFPYRVVKFSKSDKAEYYGPFRDIVETQKAINQALLQIQLLVNTNKAFIEEGSVRNIEEFRELYARVNAVIPVVSLQGIKIENMSTDIINQYKIIDAALARIKMILGVNDSFLGQAYASDSGRKVQIQRLASAAQLTMVVDRVAAMFKYVGQDIFKLVRQFYDAHQILRIADPLNEYHFTAINTPIMMPTGQVNPDGTPQVTPVMEPETDPDTGEPLYSDNGELIMVPMSDPDTKLEYADVDIRILAVRADNAEEKNQLMFQNFVNGPIGQTMLQLNPAAFLQAAAMMVSEMGTKHSIEIAKLLVQTAQGIQQGTIDPSLAMYGGDIQKIMGAAMGGSTGNMQNTPGGQGAPGIAHMQGAPMSNIPIPGAEGGNQGGMNGTI